MNPTDATNPTDVIFRICREDGPAHAIDTLPADDVICVHGAALFLRNDRVIHGYAVGAWREVWRVDDRGDAQLVLAA